ncbi:adenylyl cyclase, partial [Nocardiopsis sp. frass3]
STDSRGTTWSNGPTPGRSIPLSEFHIVREGDTAASMNAALAQGRHLLVTPGVHRLDETLEVTAPGTIVLGLGLATFIPEGGIAALRVADVDGVQLAGLLVDAGPEESEVLIEVGPPGASARHADDPIHIHDVFARVGGAGPGSAVTSLVVNSHDTIIDHVWLWRGDHGDGVGWEVNPAAHGLVVNGDDVIAYGLFAEHYQREQVRWNGERGRTYFFQCEMPYDPPNQEAFMDGDVRGFPGYRVDAGVTEHRAWGLGVYCLFLEDDTIVAERAIEAPDAAGVEFRHMVIVSLGQLGTIEHVINDTGGPAGPMNDGIDHLVSYP